MSLDQSYDCELRHNKNNKNQTRKTCLRRNWTWTWALTRVMIVNLGTTRTIKTKQEKTCLWRNWTWTRVLTRVVAVQPEQSCETCFIANIYRLSMFHIHFFTNLLSNYAIRFKVHLHLVRCLDFRVSQNSIDLPHGCHGGVWRNSVITLQKYSSIHLIELAFKANSIYINVFNIYQ